MKIRGKRGQREEGFGLVGLLIALVVLGLAVWLIGFGGWRTITNIFNISGTSSLDSVVQGCQIASIGQNSFCSELKYTQLEGKNQYVTCSYLASQGRLDSNSAFTCETSLEDLRANCKNLKKTNILVNGQNVTVENNCDKLTK